MAHNYYPALQLRKILDDLYPLTRTCVRSIPELLFAPAGEDNFRPFSRNDTWGGYDCDGRFKIEYVPESEMAGKALYMSFSTGREGKWNAVNPQCLVSVDGAVKCAMDTNHREVCLSACADPLRPVLVEMDAWSGLVSDSPESLNNAPSYMRASVFCEEPSVYQLYWDMKTPWLCAMELAPGSADRIRLETALISAADELDMRQPDSPEFYASVTRASQVLQKALYEHPDKAEATAYAVGHTHIDVAWLWTYSHTRRKAARSFATALCLAKKYKDYVFMSSQPQLYEYVRQDHPELFERIRQCVKDGQWEPEGGMWVEADCNLSSGESLVRQFIHGKRYFQEHFGVDSKILWLPDVFGYSAALPQICKKAGIDYFMTTKLSWNDTDTIPFDSFYWRGIDGTELLTHFAPPRDYRLTSSVDPQLDRRTTYNGKLEPKEVMGADQRYQDKVIGRSFLFPYGYGDGGGGTTYEMVEQGLRMKNGFPGCPAVKMTKSLDFFKDLEQEMAHARHKQVWNGELYLEYHRGTYTSIAKNKRNNRKCELLLQKTEYLASLASALKQMPYPLAELNGLWKKVLTNQFHDVLPGSSIRPVYDDTDKIYAQVFADAGKLCDHATKALFGAKGDTCYVVYNTLGYCRSGYVLAEAPQVEGAFHLIAPDGTAIAVQHTWDGKVIFYANAPAMGYASYRIAPGAAPSAPKLVADKLVAENAQIRIRFDDQGALVSVFDKQAEREVLLKGEIGNRLETYEDRPHKYDAWDIEIYHRDKRWDIDPQSITLIESGPCRVVYRVRYAYLSSAITQDIILYALGARIDFVTTVDWRQEHILLKTAFPVQILSPNATYEIQFGAVERPTHANTSWDFARFETCAQRFADLGEDGYGVALMNDCKYGYDIHDNVMRLSLLRSPTYPCKNADQQAHQFTYSFFPHAGSWQEAGVPKCAYDLNQPLYALLSDQEPKGTGFASCDNANVVMDVLKLAENADGYILRLYEAFGRRGSVTVSFGESPHQVAECDLIERKIGDMALDGSDMRFDLLPFEIKTFKIN